jgi:hypothetical protein
MQKDPRHRNWIKDGADGKGLGWKGHDAKGPRWKKDPDAKEAGRNRTWMVKVPDGKE